MANFDDDNDNAAPFGLPPRAPVGAPFGGARGALDFGKPPTQTVERDPWQNAPFFHEAANDMDFSVRVEWFDPLMGRSVMQGDLPAFAGIETLLRTFKKAGRYRMTLFKGGMQTSDETKEIIIAEDHATLQMIKRGESASAPVLGAHAAAPAQAAPDFGQLHQMLQSVLAPQQAAVEAERARLADLERTIREQRSQAEDLTRGAATLLMDRTAADTQRVIEMQSTLATKVTEQQGSAFAGVLQIMQAQQAIQQQQAQQANDMFLARLTAMQDAERIANERRMQEQANMLEMRRQDIEREKNERDARLQRERDEDRRRAEEERSREREHYERMSKMAQEARDPLSTTMATFGTIAAALKGAGIEIPDLLGKLMGGGGGDGGSIWSTVIGEVGKTVRTAMETQKAIAMGGAEEASDEGEEDEDEEEVQKPNVRLIPQQPVTPPAIAAQPTIPAWAAAANAPAPSNVVQMPTAAPAPVASRAVATMPLPDLKKARKAAKALVAELRAKPESEWQAAVGMAIVSEPLLWTYIQAMTLRGALVEIGVEQPLAERIVAMVKADGSIPAEVIG